jgi:hypothetical protein
MTTPKDPVKPCPLAARPLVTGYALRCSYGTRPSIFTADTSGPATYDQTRAVKNIAPFGSCLSYVNPTNSETLATLGQTGYPTDCMPIGCANWTPVTMSPSSPALPMATTASQCSCPWGGVITVA